MRTFNLNNTIRILNLPIKFIYLLICNIFFIVGLIVINLPFKKRLKKFNRHDSVICLSHVAISFDGRIKKSANQLSKFGFKVKLIKPCDAHEDQDLLRSGLVDSVTIKPVGLSGVFDHFPRMFDLWMFLYVLFSKEEYLHCHDVNTSFIGILVAKITGKIVVCDFHEWQSQTTNSIDKNKKLNIIQIFMYELVEKLVLKNADFIIAVNEVIAEEIKKHFKINRKILIVKNIPEIKPLMSYNLRDKLNISNDKLVVYYIGQMAPFRNIDNVILAVAELTNIVAVFQGTIQPSYFDKLNQLIYTLKIHDKVFFLPAIPHDFIPSACQGADIGIFTCHAISKNLYYSLPNKLFEYIVGEIPIICEDIPVARSYIEKYKIGTLIDSKDSKTITLALNNYLTNKDILKEYKQNVLVFKQELRKNNEIENVYSYIYQSSRIKS